MACFLEGNVISTHWVLDLVVPSKKRVKGWWRAWRTAWGPWPSALTSSPIDKLQPPGPFCSYNSPSRSLPQGLCTGFPSAWTVSPLILAWLFLLVTQASAQMSPPPRDLPRDPIVPLLYHPATWSHLLSFLGLSPPTGIGEP